MGNQNRKSWPETDTLALDLQRFSGLSSEMVSLLQSLTQDIKRSAQELREVRDAVDAGKKELLALRESEKEISVLKQQLEDLRPQKESLENLIAAQRNAWEEEQTKRASEEREHEENLKTAEEADILARESALKKKEQELIRLMQELEKFLSGLAGRKGTVDFNLESGI